jgi:predicted nucleotidyltransferase
MNYDVLLHAQELIVFGSYAAGVSEPESDIDVLAVGPRSRIARSGLDLISVTPKHLTSDELAWV